MSVPEDKNNQVYTLFLMHGMALTMPWQTMVEVFEYFGIFGDKTNGELYRYYFGITSMGPRIIAMIINLFLPKSCGSLSARMLFSIGIQSLVMAFVVLLTFSRFDTKSNVMDWLVVVSTTIMNIVGGIYMSSAYGSTGAMPMKYTNALCLGSYLGFVLVQLVDLTFNAIPKTILEFIPITVPTMVAVLYFTSSVVLHILCIVLEITSKPKAFRVYYQKLEENKQKYRTKTNTRTEETDIKGNRYLYVFTQISEQSLDIFLTYFVTFCFFPIFQTKVFSSDNWVKRSLFVIISLLIAETFYFFGAIIAKYFQYPTTEAMIAFTSSRLLSIPMALFVNYCPKGEDQRLLPVLIKSDLIYWALVAIQGIISGHLSALSVMYAPKQVRPQYAHIAGMMSSIFMPIGWVFGQLFSSVLENIV